MTIKIDTDAIRKRLEQKKEKNARDPKKDLILKPTEEGTIKFRAVQYPHTDDPSAEPIAERYYHNNIPSHWQPFYCPKANENEQCFLCDFVWEMVKEHKGTEANKQWLDRLPQLTLYVPGLVRGREEEGPKLWRIRSSDRKQSPNHEKLYEWLLTPGTSLFMDPEKGYDILLKYEAVTDEQKKVFPKAKFLPKRTGADLDREQTKFGPGYKEFMELVPNIDDVYPVKNSQDSLTILTQWQAKMGMEETPTDTSDGVVKKATPTTSPLKGKNEATQASSEEDVEAQLKELGL
jgi:hypothetical protein